MALLGLSPPLLLQDQADLLLPLLLLLCHVLLLHALKQLLWFLMLLP